MIISSGARNMMELRGPYDVINMGTLFGMSQDKAKRAISENCKAVLARGAARKLHFGVMMLVPAGSGAPQEDASHGDDAKNSMDPSDDSLLRGASKKKRVR
jgi:ribonuclease P/MRP protein subunit RPP1